MRILRSLRFLLAATACLVAGAAGADDAFPSKPIRLVVPYTAGGGSDILARLYADKLRARLGQNVIVDNKPGAGTLLGASLVARSPADGYTLFLTSNSTFIAPHSIAKPPLDVMRELTPVAMLTDIVFVLVASPTLPAKNARELITYLKANPGKVSYGSASRGGSTHLMGEMFNMHAGVSTVNIPYTGSAGALNDLLAGRLQLMFDAMVTSAPHIQSGKVHPIAIASGKRWVGMPELPTLAESGLASYSADGWYGIFAPAGTPAAIVQRINAATAEVMKDADMAKRSNDQALIPNTMSPAAFAEIVRNDYAKWGKVVKDIGMPVQ